MMTRSELREHMFRICFSIEFVKREEIEEQIDLYFEHNDVKSEEDCAYIKNRILEMMEHLEKIDETIEGHAKGWSLNRLGKSELSILRIATYEILIDEDIPNKVALNEAIELSKKYCNEKAASFINGILGKIGTYE